MHNMFYVIYVIGEASIHLLWKEVKKAKCRHLSNIINKNCSRPKILF